MVKIDNELFDKIIKGIESGSIPDKDYSFSDEYIYESGYSAEGYLLFEGKSYTFRFNKEEGIFYDTIELENEDE